MNTTIKALQKLYEKLGGNLSDTYSDIAHGKKVGKYCLIPNMIKAIAKKAPSGGASLPAVTSEDNGDVLTVVEGAWAKAEAPSGGDGVDVYDIYQTDPITGYFFIDATMAEVQASVTAKNVLFRNVPFGGLGDVTLMTGYRIYEDSENDDALTLELVQEGNGYNGDTFSTYYRKYKFVGYNGSLRGQVATNGYEVIEQANLIVTMSKSVDEDTHDVSYYCDVTYSDIADAFDTKPVLLAFDDTFDADERTNQFVQMRSFENASNKIEYYAVIDSTLSPATTTSTFVAYSLNEDDEVTKTTLGTVALTSI